MILLRQLIECLNPWFREEISGGDLKDIANAEMFVCRRERWSYSCEWRRLGSQQRVLFICMLL
jgi:hypothetical protein